MLVDAHNVKNVANFILHLDQPLKHLGEDVLEVVKVRSRTLSSLVAEYLVGGIMRW
jgi:hypothetical protein